MIKEIKPENILISAVAENIEPYLHEVEYLFKSLRYHGGNLKKAKCIAYFVNSSTPEIVAKLAALDVKVKIVEPIDVRCPYANKIQMLNTNENFEYLVALDTDTIIVNDFSNFLNGYNILAKPVDGDPLTLDQWRMLFEYFGLNLPLKRYKTTFTYTDTIPYFNSGVIIIPKQYVSTLHETWKTFLFKLLDNYKDLTYINKHAFFTDQFAFALSLESAHLPYEPLPVEMNFPIHNPISPLFNPQVLTPYIIHYHHRFSQDWKILHSSYNNINIFIDTFNSLSSNNSLKVESKKTAQDAILTNENQHSKVICVLGMHRSGTSALMGVLHYLGLYLGSNLLNPAQENPKGFFENRDITLLNDKILNALHSSWDDVFLLPDGWWENRIIEDYIREATELIKMEFSSSTMFGVKDPRLCILLPLWQKIFNKLHIDPYFIIIIRNPLEVAESLYKRNDFSMEKSAILWMRYMLNGEFYTRGLNRTFVSFDELLKNPEEVIKSISNNLNINFPKHYKDVSFEIKQFLEPKLKHHNISLAGIDQQLIDIIKDYFSLLIRLVNDEDERLLLKIDKIRKHFFETHKLFYFDNILNLSEQLKEATLKIDSLNSDLNNKDVLIEGLKQDLNNKDVLIEGLKQDLNAFINSTTWKLTAPLRKIMDNVKKLFTNLTKINIKIFTFLKNFFRSNTNQNSTALLKIINYLPADPIGYAVICFPIIDWEFRIQRPQHLMQYLANNGARVFYLSLEPKLLTQNYNDNYIDIRPIANNVFGINWIATRYINPYKDELSDDDVDVLMKWFNKLRMQEKLHNVVCISHLPFWEPIISKLQKEWEAKLVYDCMDDHSGFSTNSQKMLDKEELLITEADLVVTTSMFLENKWKNKVKKNCVRIPNGVDIEHFSKYTNPKVDKPKNKKLIIGYYGAISEWFDTELIANLANKKSEWEFILVGSTFGANINIIRTIPNIKLLGEKPYSEIPSIAKTFDACIIPFKDTSLIKATNPVKFYEYLALGKPIVTSKIPELELYNGKFVKFAYSVDEWIKALEDSIKENTDDLIRERIKFAKNNSWETRGSIFKKAISDLFPKVLIVIATYNGINLTKDCIESIYNYTDYPNWELVVVDNGSTDGTREYLTTAKTNYPNLYCIFNDSNLGFAKANNIGIRSRSSDIIILLNNDTVVTKGWVSRFVDYLKDPQIGIVGPVTNNIGNEAKINAIYNDIQEMHKFAYEYTSNHKGEYIEIPVVALFCAAVRRPVLESAGFLDERYRIGMFEDDDLSMTIRSMGLKVICAEDIFIHHIGKGTFNKLSDNEYKAIFEENKKKYEIKWNQSWLPHKYREQSERIRYYKK